MCKFPKYLVFLLFFVCNIFLNVNAETGDSFDKARANAILANEGFKRSELYVHGWMKHVDKRSGLLPRNLSGKSNYWNAWDAAADNYAFMVLTSAMLMPDFFNTTALNMLKTERKLTSRIGTLPDTYYFNVNGFKSSVPDTSSIIFGAAEYMKDGLIPITEWIGKSPWSDRIVEMLADLPKLVNVVHNLDGEWFGNSAVPEVNGDLMQVLNRMYWMTGNKSYLDWAYSIADFYFTKENLPTNQNRLRLRDHGCEVISGLCEIYYTSYYKSPEKYKKWKPFVHQMLDTILEKGRNEDGLFYDEVNPITGEVLETRLADNFGYTLNGYYSVAVIDSVERYKIAIVDALKNLNSKYRNFNWENGNADGYADAIEGTLNLYNRIPTPEVAAWLDSEIKVMWKMQKQSGIIEGWHGDGNFARTSLMYSLWKTNGILPEIWRDDLKIGTHKENQVLFITLEANADWQGKIKFDTQRHNRYWNFPTDYPRINQFQEWFTVDEKKNYRIEFVGDKKTKKISGKLLKKGLQLTLKPGQLLKIKLQPVS